MIWLYRLQQRLSITRQEALAILTLTGLFLLGTTVRHVRQQMTPPLTVAPLVAQADSTHTDSVRTDSAQADPELTDATPSSGAQPDATTSGRIDVNAASTARLQTLPGIGPALAGRIETYRARRSFRTVGDLERVSGIGPKTLAKLRPLVTVGK